MKIEANNGTLNCINHYGHRSHASSTANRTNLSHCILRLSVRIAGILLSSIPWISRSAFRKCQHLRLCLRKSHFLRICDVAHHNRKSHLFHNSTHHDAHIQWSFGDSLCVGHLDSITSWIIVHEQEGIIADVGTAFTAFTVFTAFTAFTVCLFFLFSKLDAGCPHLRKGPFV